MPTLAEAAALVPDIARLTDDQFAWVQRLIVSMAIPCNSTRDSASDVFTDDRSTGLFFLYLVTHHVLSAEPFKGEKFEYAVERIMTALNHVAARPTSRTNRGHDLTVNGERWSFKTEAHRAIRADTLSISKWMELGIGQWGSDENDLRGLCDLFLHHLEGYDRIFTLRCLTPDSVVEHHYEILEIPKHILTQAGGGAFQMMHSSRQNPKPGYCRVSDTEGLMYELYFDGGTERKLQVKKLRRNLCAVHAEWRFETPLPPAIP